MYAEDPYAGFLPQAGVASLVTWPARARVDAALVSGQRVSTHYDPLLGKIIATGATREAARQALVTALDETAILGLTTNLGFLRTLAASPFYRDSAIDTGWLDSHPDELQLETPVQAWCLAAWGLATSGAAGATNRDSRHPFAVADGWRAGAAPAAVPLELSNAAVAGDSRLLTVDVAAGSVSGPSGRLQVRPVGGSGRWLRLEIDGQVHEGQVLVEPHHVLVAFRGQTYVFDRPDAFGPGGRTVVGDGSVTAPMPGTVLSVQATVGAPVEAGATLGVMEAMKMELVLTAPFEGWWPR